MANSTNTLTHPNQSNNTRNTLDIDLQLAKFQDITPLLLLLPILPFTKASTSSIGEEVRWKTIFPITCFYCVIIAEELK